MGDNKVVSKKKGKSSLDKVREEVIKSREEVYSKNRTKNKKKLDRSNLIFIGIIALITIGFFVLNYYLKFQLPVYLLNGYSEPIKYLIDGEEEYTVKPGEFEKVRVSEGQHVYEVSGAIEKEIKANFENKFFQRFSNNEFLFAINPGGESILMMETTTYYSEDIPIPAGAGNSYSYLWGEVIEEREDIDYVFKDFPDEISLGDGEEVEKKTRVHYSGYNVEDFMRLEEPYLEFSQRRDFLENYITLYPESSIYADSYLSLYFAYSPVPSKDVPEDDDLDEFLRFVKFNRDNNLESIPAHRLYQDFRAQKDGYDDVKDEYLEFLSQEPDNPDYLYLVGRLESEDEKEVEYFTKALEIDPDHAYANFGMGAMYAQEFDYARVISYLERALERDGNNANFNRCYKIALAGLDEWGKLIEMSKEVYDKYPYDFRALESLVIYLVEAGDVSRAQKLYTDFGRNMSHFGDYSYQDYFDTIVAETKGNPDDYSEDLIDPSFKDYSAYRHLTYLLLKEDYEGAFDMINDDKDDELKSEVLVFIVAVGLEKQGKDSLSDKAVGELVNILEDGFSEYNKELINALKKKNVSPDELMDMELNPYYKSLLGVYLWYESDSSDERFLDIGKRRPVYPGFYSRMLERLAE